MLPRINLFGISVATYPVMVLLSVVTGLILFAYFLRKNDYSWVFIVKLFALIVLGFFVGARLLNVLLHLDYYSLAPSLIFRFHLKGFSVLGGMVGAMLVSLFFVRHEKKDIKAFFDITVIPFFASFFLMKVGCFLNGCCGGNLTASCLGVNFPTTASASNPAKMLEFVSGLLMIPRAVYPTQLFEALLVLAFVPAIFFLKRKNLSVGKLFVISAVYFLCVRLTVHFFRDFPYPPVATNIIYPALYVVLIVTLVLYYHFVLCAPEKY